MNEVEQSSHDVVVRRSGAECSCGEFRTTSVIGADSMRLAMRHSREVGGATIIDMRVDDPTGELAEKRAKRTHRIRTDLVRRGE